MAHVLGPNVEGPSANAYWEPPMLGNVAIPLISTEALTGHQLKLLATYEWVVELRQPNIIPDIMGHRESSFIVSARIRDWLVEHQPSQPGFYRVRMKVIDSAPASRAPLDFYVMGHIPELDPIDVERTSWSGGMYGYPDGKTLDTSMNAKCAVHASLIAGLHIWRTTHRQGRKYMCSNAFWRFFASNRLTGWSSWKECTEINK